MPARLGLNGLVARASAPTRDAALPSPSLPPIRCAEGRVYAGRTVRLADARRFDAPRERTERWC